MSIREAKKDDAYGIAKVHVKAWKVGYSEIMPKEYLDSLSIEQKIETWSKSLSEKSLGINLVIVEEKLIIGFCVFGPARDKDLSNNNFGELVALNILPSHWGKGFGTMAIKHILKDSKAKKWSAIYLWVLKQNTRARAIYEAHGFIPDGTEKLDKSLTGHELHELRYVKIL